jgi:hypothetical protein
MGFTEDNQADEQMLEARDRRLGVSWRRRRALRADIPVSAPLPGANAWQGGCSVQTTVQEVDLKRR